MEMLIFDVNTNVCLLIGANIVASRSMFGFAEGLMLCLGVVLNAAANKQYHAN